MEKELYIKVKNELIRNKKLDFKTYKNVASDIIDYYNLNNYILKIENTKNIKLACYQAESKKMNFNFNAIKKYINNEEKTDQLAKLYYLFDTLMHEIRHAMQQKEIKEDGDLLLSKFHFDTKKNQMLYQMLHNYNPIEIDANFEAQMQTEKFFMYTDYMDNLISEEKANAYILSNVVNIFLSEEGILSPALHYYFMLGETMFIDSLDHLPLEQRIRYGLNVSKEELEKIIKIKEDGKQIHTLIKKM